MITMTATSTIVRAGLSRGLIEWRQSFSGAGLIGHLFWPVLTLIAMFWLRFLSVGVAGMSLGTMILPGALGMFVAFGASLIVQYLVADREDGTLLRAKATPNGIRGYLVGKLVTVSLTVLTYLLILLVPGLIFLDGLDVGIRSWAILGWILLGLVATQSIGAALGAMITTSRGTGYLGLAIMALTAVSGIFYPITALPGWLQAVAQVFPIYWLGLGMRSALLPAEAVAVEIGQAWRHLETVAVLGGWAIAGMILAPILLGRAARRESGSRVTERRERAERRTV